MADIRDLEIALEKLKSVLSVPTHNSIEQQNEHGEWVDGTGLELRDVSEIKNTIQDAINSIQKEYNKEADKLKKTARQRLITATVNRFREANTPPRDDQISNFIDATYNNQCHHDTKQGEEFFLWYWCELQKGSKWNKEKRKFTSRQETRFFNDIRRWLTK